MNGERYIPCVVSEEAGIICDSEDVKRGVRLVWDQVVEQAECGVNEQFVIEEKKLKDGSFSLAINLVQFYPRNILIDRLGLK